MRAATCCGARCIELADRPDPGVAAPGVAAPADAVARVVLTCVCGSDLWYYRDDEITRVVVFLVAE
jgi:threonine dehydrogenase-like Zn-dependent dehydrogenase